MAEDREQPGQGARPGIEDQASSTGHGKPAQVPGVPGSLGGEAPNPDGFDQSPAAEELRPEVGEGAGDPHAGAGSLDEGSSKGRS